MKFQELLKKLDVDALAEAYLMYDGIYRKTMYNDKLTESEKNEKIRKYKKYSGRVPECYCQGRHRDDPFLL